MFRDSFTGNNSTTNKATNLASEPANNLHAVKYYVKGHTESVSLTYNNAQGGTQQEKATVPWEASYHVPNGSFLYISAQNQEDSGYITVKIFVDGVEFKSSDAYGGYTIASASGRCCK